MEEDLTKRLKQLSVTKFLSEKLFKRLSENMHYETLKYLNCKDLLEVRGVKLGGYQLTSNKLLRSRIKNYFTLDYIPIENNHKHNIKIMQLICQQAQAEAINVILKYPQMTCKSAIKFFTDFNLYPEITGIQLYNIFTIGDLRIGFKSLAKNLHKITNLKEFSIGIYTSANCCYTREAKVLVKHFKELPNLTKFQLKDNYLGDEGISALALNLKFIPNLEYLDLSSNSFQLKGIMSLAENMKFISQLKNLDLSDNLIYARGAEVLVENIRFLPKLNNLNLNNNTIGKRAAEMLANILKFLPHLEILKLNDNKIGYVGIKAFAEILYCLKHLRFLDLDKNWTSDCNKDWAAYNLLQDAKSIFIPHLELKLEPTYLYQREEELSEGDI